MFMMGYVMLLAVLTMLGNLLSDILYSVADPRIRLK
jgi:peptide/nickel transport system permease protein